VASTRSLATEVAARTEAVATDEATVRVVAASGAGVAPGAVPGETRADARLLAVVASQADRHGGTARRPFGRRVRAFGIVVRARGARLDARLRAGRAPGVRGAGGGRAARTRVSRGACRCAARARVARRGVRARASRIRASGVRASAVRSVRRGRSCTSRIRPSRGGRAVAAGGVCRAAAVAAGFRAVRGSRRVPRP